jgi:CheY-like chemotaxis protein
MDLEMPIMGGFDALFCIRELQAAAGEEPCIVYAFTGYNDADTITKIEKSGFDGILTKPLHEEEFEKVLELISVSSASAMTQDELWIEKSFVDAFPGFLDSRRGLIDDIERSAYSGDMNTLRRAAHTLSGSPAMHGFNKGISICRAFVAMANDHRLVDVDKLVSELRKLLSNPVIR